MTHAQPDGFLAAPPAGRGTGVLVLHAWWGLNDTIKAFCTRLASSGFTAFAPDLYHGRVADNIPGAETLGSALDRDRLQAEADVAGAAEFLNEYVGSPDRGIAVIAFSMGVYYALHLAGTAPQYIRSVVLFYGTDGAAGGDYTNSRAAYLGHFAGNDQFEPPSNVDHLEETLEACWPPGDFLSLQRC